MAKDTTPKEPRQTPYVVAGVKDPDSVYVQISHTSTQTREVLKELGAEFQGGMNKWKVGKEAYETNINKVNDAYAADREARANAPKAEKAEKEPKAELTEEQKAERAAASRASALERDGARTPVLAGSIAEGGSVEVKGQEVAVTKVGRSFVLDEKGAADLAERFAGSSFKAGDEVAYASFDPEELKKKLDAADATPEP